MPFNGSGTFVRLRSWVTDQANGLLVRADLMDSDTNDIAAGLSQCVTKDGQSGALTANLQMGSYKITGLANGSAANDAVTYGQAFTNPVFTGNGSISGTWTVGGILALTTGGTTPTATAGNNSTTIANTAFVQTAIAAVNAQLPLTVSIATGTTQAAAAGTHYVCTNVAAVTVTLPASPSSGDTIWFTFTNGLATNVIARNGKTIMALSEDMTVDLSTGLTVELRYVNSDWRLV